jgi:hypothetical protein
MQSAVSREFIEARQRQWLADQSLQLYMHGRPTPEFRAYERYKQQCWYTEASCYAAALISMGGTLEDAHAIWQVHCGPTEQSGCDTGAVVRDHITEMVLIDIPVGLASGAVKLVAERAVFTAASALDDAAYSASKIKITERGLTHVLDRHVADGALSANKSLFADDVVITRLIADADAVVPVIQPRNGNLAYIVDAGRTIGVDRTTNAGTSIYTVITRPSGELVTAFPGLP